VPSKRTLLSAAVSVVGVAALVVWALDQPAPSWPGGTAELLALAAGLAAFIVATLLRAARWRSLALAAGVPLGAGEAVSLTVSGYALNNVLPARAGDVYRGLTIARDGVPLSAAAGSIVAERVLDAAALGALLLAALLVGPDGARLPEDLHGALVLGFCGAALAAVGLVAVLWRRARLFLVNLLSSLAAIGWRTVAVALLVSVVLWGLEALVYVLTGHAVGVPIDLLGAAYVLAIANLVGALPSAPSAVGTYDVAVVFAARSLGASGAAAVSYVLALRAVLFLPITVIGILVLVVRRRQARPPTAAPAPSPVAGPLPARASGPTAEPTGATAAPAPLLVVMPALDEAATIAGVLEQVRTQILDRVAGSRAVVADDGSRDDTPRLLARIAAADPRIGVLRADAPTGQGPATRRAIESAPAQWYLHMDSDGQVDVSDFAALWALREQADLVLGVRRRRKDPPHRMVITKATRGLVGRVAGRPLHDAATPLRLIRGTLWDDLRPFVGPHAMSFSILVSVAAVRRGWRVAELDVAHHPRQAGRSRLQGLGMLRMIAKGMFELRTLTRATSAGRGDDAPR